MEWHHCRPWYCFFFTIATEGGSLHTKTSSVYYQCAVSNVLFHVTTTAISSTGSFDIFEMSQPPAHTDGASEDVYRTYGPGTYDCNALVARYTAWWPFPDGATGLEADEARIKREQNQNQMCIDYYDLVSPSYEQGWGKQFHYCPMLPGRSIKESLIEYEIEVGKLTGLKDGMKVLDIGCGVGGPARTIARRFGCKVTGLVNSPWHVERGTQLNKEAGLESMIDMFEGDYHVSR